MNQVLVYAACTILALWGIAHLVATRGVVAGFGPLTEDNRRIITMEWVIEGVALIATASFVAAATAGNHESPVTFTIYAVAIGTLLVLAIVSSFTGARIAFLPFRLCPFVLVASATLIAAGAWL